MSTKAANNQPTRKQWIASEAQRLHSLRAMQGVSFLKCLAEAQENAKIIEEMGEAPWQDLTEPLWAVYWAATDFARARKTRKENPIATHAAHAERLAAQQLADVLALHEGALRGRTEGGAT